MSRAKARRPARILVVDDDPGLLRLLTIRLRSEHYVVEPAESAAAALAAVARFRPDLALTDLRMAQMDGLALLKELKRRWPSLNVIMLTAHGTIPDAVRATQSGAFAFLTKPVEKEQLLDEVRRALKTSGFAEEEASWEGDFVTRSPLLEDLLARARMAASGETPVYVSGEPGTGRETLARAIHRASARSGGPLVELACPGLEAPDGEERLREGAHASIGGTLLLCDLDELPVRLHGTLVAAFTSSNDAVLPRLVATGEMAPEQWLAETRPSPEFAELVSGVHFAMPALARRREDIPLLVAEVLEDLAWESGQPIKNCAPDALETLAAVQWPGNVRQLRSVVREAAVLAPGPIVTADLVQQALGSTSQVPSFDEARDEFTRAYLVQLLKVTSGNVSQAARLARRNRTDFYKLLQRFALSPDAFK